MKRNSTRKPEAQRGDGRCKSHEGAAGRHSRARAGNGPAAPAVTGQERVPGPSASGANSGGTADKKKRGTSGCEEAWTGARASAGPQGGPQPARVEGKATERPDPCEA